MTPPVSIGPSTWAVWATAAIAVALAIFEELPWTWAATIAGVLVAVNNAMRSIQAATATYTNPTLKR